MKDIESPIFICGNTKAGTTLFQSLLDWHPSLFVVPIELKFFKFFNVPRLPPGNFATGALDCGIPIPSSPAPTLTESIRQMASVLELGDLIRGNFNKRGINIENSFDRKKLEKELKSINASSTKDAYEQIVKCIFRSTNKNMGKRKRLVEKTPHLEEFAQELKRWFPKSKFVHVMRNPYANIYSMRKNDPIVGPLRSSYRMTAKSYYFMERNKEYIDNYKVVRYEDIVLETKKTLREVAEFLGIEFVSSLTKPTIMGKSWGGNSNTQSSSFTGIDPAPVTAFQGKIHPFDKAVVNRFFSPILEEYGYKKRHSSWKKWLPSGIEPPISFIMNRWLLFENTL